MLKNIESEIETIIAQSEVPEDPIHSKNTREWVLKLKPQADMALQIAALGHDIERSIIERKIKRANYTNYNDFKLAHSRNSANILYELLSKFNINSNIIERVTYLVLNHEFGGNPDANILRDADSISYFDVNLPYYFQRHSEEETVFRIKWGYNKLSKAAKSIVINFNYVNIELETLFKNVALNKSNL